MADVYNYTACHHTKNRLAALYNRIKGGIIGDGSERIWGKFPRRRGGAYSPQIDAVHYAVYMYSVWSSIVNVVTEGGGGQLAHKTRWL